MIKITDEQLDPEAISKLVRKPANGAVVTFLGTTRDATENRQVLHLEYETYESMAKKVMAEVIKEVRDRWSVEDVAIVHRIGKLAIGEISMVVVVASPHRKAAFSACQDAVDQIKKTVPIWKKEYFNGGEVWIESPEDIALRKADSSEV